jgi:hypothetical protein
MAWHTHAYALTQTDMLYLYITHAMTSRTEKLKFQVSAA